MNYERKDFSKDGIYFTPRNFKKGDIFWFDPVGRAYEIVGDWISSPARNKKVSCKNLTYGYTEFFYKEQLPRYFRLKKAKKDTIMNHEEIKKSIESFPGICVEGKKAISKILENFGYVPPKVGPTIPDGIYQGIDKNIVIVKNNTYQYIKNTILWTPVIADYAARERWVKLGDLQILKQLKSVLNSNKDI